MIVLLGKLEVILKIPSCVMPGGVLKKDLLV